MIKEFKDFINRGNVLDLAVAFILGAAFGRVVNSFVNDILMPPIGLLLGKVNFTDLFVNLGEGTYESLKAAQDAGAPTINYGLFVNALLDFVIVAFVLFLIIRQVNRARGVTPPETQDCPYCLSKIPAGATRCSSCTSEISSGGTPA